MQSLIKDLHTLKNGQKIAIYKNFHKTGDEGYAKGEEFLGITVPQLRKLAIKYQDTSFHDIKKLLRSRIHEEKYLAVLILVEKYQKHDESARVFGNEVSEASKIVDFRSLDARGAVGPRHEKEKNSRKKVFDFCIENASLFSGWDLVDTVAPSIFGHFLYHMGRDYPAYKKLLANLAKSSNLWERRIAIISTSYFIRQNQFDETIKISEILLNDCHDLIHKAVGWMLREVGKKDISSLKGFLNNHYKEMPRTMLRYAIEKFPEKERQKYLKRA